MRILAKTKKLFRNPSLFIDDYKAKRKKIDLSNISFELEKKIETTAKEEEKKEVKEEKKKEEKKEAKKVEKKEKRKRKKKRKRKRKKKRKRKRKKKRKRLKKWRKKKKRKKRTLCIFKEWLFLKMDNYFMKNLLKFVN